MIISPVKPNSAPESAETAPTVPTPADAPTTAGWNKVVENAKNEVNDAAMGPAKPAPLDPTVQTNAAKWSAGDALQFSGPAPEVINGRLAMLGFAAAVAAELSTGERVSTQFTETPLAIVGVFVLFIVASLIPIFRGANPNEGFGVFNPKAEKINGRAAMIGFASLLVVEYFKGAALF